MKLIFHYTNPFFFCMEEENMYTNLVLQCSAYFWEKKIIFSIFKGFNLTQLYQNQSNQIKSINKSNHKKNIILMGKTPKKKSCIKNCTMMKSFCSHLLPQLLDYRNCLHHLSL